MILKKILSKAKICKTITGLVVLFFMLSFQYTFAQQNVQSSQYIFNTVAVNPAYAGFKEDWYLQAGHRMQWDNMGSYKNDGNGVPMTTQVSIDGVIDPYRKNVGVGLQLTSESLGAQSVLSLYGNYAYRIQLDRADLSRLCFGLAFGITRYGINENKLRYWDTEDPLLNSKNSNTHYIPDIRFGVYYYNPKFYIGFSAMNLLSGQDSSSILNWNDTTSNIVYRTHLYLMGGTLLGLTDYTKLRPSIIIREDFKGPTNIDLSALFVFDNRFWIGGSYRTGFHLWKGYSNGQSLSISNALVGIVNFQVSDRFRIGYSYDFSLNSLNSAQNGSHELTIGWFLLGRSKRVLSPRFF